MTSGVIVASTGLAALDGALVALPRHLSFRRLAPLRSAWFALALPGSTAACVFAITLWPVVALGLGALALLAIPILAAVTLSVAMHGARRWLVAAVPALLLLAIVLRGGWPAGAASVALTSLSTVSLAALLTYLTPLRWLKWGIVAMSVVDVTLVATGLLQPANIDLNEAAVASLPQLQSIDVGGITQGYGDLFLAALLGGVLASKGRAQLRVAVGLGVTALVFYALLLSVSVLPTTVLPAGILLITEIFEPNHGWRRWCTRWLDRLRRQPVPRFGGPG